MTETFTGSSHSDTFHKRMATMPPTAESYPIHPTLTLDVEGVTISVRFDRFDGDQPTYEWTVATTFGDAASDSGPSRGQGGTPIALDAAMLQILEGMRDQPELFPHMNACCSHSYVAAQAAHYLPTGDTR